MSLHAHLTATCDGCGIQVERDVPLNKKTAEGLMSEDDGVHSWASDMWSWIIPDGWLQLPFDKKTKQEYLFFHSDDCYIEWLTKQGRIREIKRFKSAVWMG